MPYHAIFSVKLLAAIAVFFIAVVMVGRGQGFHGMHARRRAWLTVAACLGPSSSWRRECLPRCGLGPGSTPFRHGMPRPAADDGG